MMLKRVLQIRHSKMSFNKCGLSQIAQTIENSGENSVSIEVKNSLQEQEYKETYAEKSLLDPLSEDISHVTTFLKPTFNFAAYANKSEIIQELVKLGVDMHYIETKKNAAVPLILKLNFEHIKEHILFLNNLGIDFKDIGILITKNPYIFKEQLEDLKVRINYLKSKKFTNDMVSRIISKNPYWLSYSTQDIDTKLGFFQKYFNLSGPEVREVASKKPQLITHNQEKVKLNIFVLREEMGFQPEDLKEVILKKPSIFMNGQHRLIKCFDYLHNVMNIPHERVLEMPEILTCREKRLKERHQFLVKLKRDQFDPKKPNYIGLTSMIACTDAEFATEIAKSSVEEYNMFLKTM